MLFAGSTARRKTSEKCALSFPNCDCPPFTETSHGSRSRLYRRHILQVNTRWKALAEIYKIYMLLHRSDLNISENFRQTFSHFLAKLQKFVIFEFFSLIFAQILMKFCRNFADNLENVENFRN